MTPSSQAIRSLAVMTSGGDAPGMNAAIRAVVRRAISRGLKVYGIRRGWLGAVEGGDAIVAMDWDSVGGILQRGGTILGTARCRRFRTREGRRQAAVNLYTQDIDALVVIGGDGSLTGALILQDEWPGLLQEAADAGEVILHEDPPRPLRIVGLPGSIDNDTYGSDMSIGADTALHRIVTAADQLTSTASAHQRTFIVEVMGRNCGYLALAGGLASGAHWVIIPEEGLDARWHQRMVKSLLRGRQAGRQHALVIMAEGARHPDGLPLEADIVKGLLEKQLGETRITVLGHVQRGGSPSAFDRILSMILGAAAVDYLLDTKDPQPVMMGLRENQVVATPLHDVIENSRKIVAMVDAGDYTTALQLRGVSFRSQLQVLKTLTAPGPMQELNQGNLLILTAGHDAPGMNAAVRVATRMAMDRGFRVLGGEYGFEGLLEGRIRELRWMDVTGWASRGGSELGTSFYTLQEQDLVTLEKVLTSHEISHMLIIGGTSVYRNASFILSRLHAHPRLRMPTVLVPATINNNVPGTDFAIGADTALNNIVQAVDKLKDTAAANKRLFIVQVMGYHSGFLAVMAGLASGAEDVFIPEEGISLDQIVEQVRKLRVSFARGRRLSIIILNEEVSKTYDIHMIQRIMEREGGDLFDVRSIILGHIQRGGAPTPFDRILAARLASSAVETLASADWDASPVRVVGLRGNQIRSESLESALTEMAWPLERPKDAWFMEYLELVRTLEI